MSFNGAPAFTRKRKRKRKPLTLIREVPMPKLNGGHLFIRCLKQEGIEKVFTIVDPGGTHAKA